MKVYILLLVFQWYNDVNIIIESICCRRRTSIGKLLVNRHLKRYMSNATHAHAYGSRNLRLKYGKC